MHLDTTLNLVWLLLGAVALGKTLRATRQLSKPCNRENKWLHIAGVTLIVAALFPYISATDDIVRMEHYASQHDRHGSNKATPTDDLIRLYEALDAPLIAHSCPVALILFPVSFVVVPLQAIRFEAAPLFAGRSPPSLSFS